jgi:hypothetical protein
MTYFAMFTDAGNAAVGEIVRSSKEKGLCWLETYQELCRLAQVSCFAEATDTAVREVVYDACGFETDFYI